MDAAAITKLCSQTILFACLCCLMATPAPALGAEEELQVLDLNRVLRPDFSGDWEKDFVRSDNWETELQRTVNQLREAAERARRAASGNRGASRPAIRIGPGGSSTPSRGGTNVSTRDTHLLDLAQLAEYISRHTVMSIAQNENEVRIIRENEADLVCSVQEASMVSFSSDVGSEACGWDGQQLIFEIRLPDQLTIQHRLSVSIDSQSLNMLTTITHGRTVPFDLIQVFSNFDAGPDSLNCRQTVTRGKVCNQITPRTAQ